MKPVLAFRPSHGAMELAPSATRADALGAHARAAAAREADPVARGEADLVARARTGDADAFRELVERHQDRAYALAQRVLRSSEDALDVTQEAFVKAWQGLPGFRGEARFGTWLHSIVVRRALDRADSLRRRARREQPLEALDSLPSGTGSVERGDALGARRLAMLIERLSPAQRASVTLFYRDGCSVEDVARMLGMNENTVKTHLSRARTLLREAWLAQTEPNS